MNHSTRGRVLIMALALAGILLAGNQTEAAITYLKSWGDYGSGDGQFMGPNDIAISPNGEVYVADTFNNRIQKFDGNGGFLTKFGTSGVGDGQFNHPQGIAITPSGEIYVGDTDNSRIQKFDSNNGFLTKFGSYGSGDGQFMLLRGVAFKPGGDIYVTDLGNHRIQKFDGNGGFLTKFGTSGVGDGQFNYPEDVAISAGGEVYVADTGNNRIQKFDSNNGFLTKFGSSGSGDGEFWNPYGIAVSPSGEIYVADLGNNRIQKFDGNGGFLTKFGTSGSGDGQFNQPGGVDVSSTGEIYVADLFNHRIQKWFDLDAWVSGTPHLDAAAVGPGQLLGASLTLDTAKGLIVVGTLNVQPGGTMTQDGGNISAAIVNNYGQLNVNGSTLTTTDYVVNSSSMTLDGGTVVGDLYNTYGAEFAGRGTIVNSGENNGTLTLTGVLTINGFWQNFGLVNLNSGTKLIGTGLFWNYPDGVIRGQGAIETSSYNEGLIHADASGPLTLSNFAGNYPSGEMRVDDGATLRLLSGSSISNEGLIVLGSATAVLAGNQMVNSGTLQGLGRVTNSLSNEGVIRVEGGQLTLAGAVVENTAFGRIEVPAGATVFVTQGLYGSNGGQIALDGGAFDNNNHTLTNTGSIAGNGTLRTGGLTNQGDVHLADGATKVYGAVTNESSGTITIEGTVATITTFYGPVDNAGVFDILSGTVRYLGGETGVVNGGLLALSGPGQIDPQSDIENNDLFLVTGGQSHTVGTITGSGVTQVAGSSQLTTPSITQGTLIIGGSGGMTAVPEPGVGTLLLIGLLGFVGWRGVVRKKA